MRAARFLLGTVVAIVSFACASTPNETPIQVEPAALDENAYRTLVHPVVERACGRSDCHGTLPRGLRVYGASALRLPNATGPTTPDEMRVTYVSITGLEPENLREFAAGRTEEKAYKLLMLAKPLTLERHRGGVSLRKGEPAERCILTWLLGTTDAIECAKP